MAENNLTYYTQNTVNSDSSDEEESKAITEKISLNKVPSILNVGVD